MPRMFSDELINKIVEEYSTIMGEGPMDSDEVQDVLTILEFQLDLHQGNITQEEFDKLTDGWE